MARGAAAAVEFAAYRALLSGVRAGAAVGLALGRTWARRAVWAERLGRWPVPTGGTGAIWIHAASVGETGVAHRLIAALRSRMGDVPILLTCNTPTARSIAERESLADEIRYFPLDHPRIVRSLLETRRPRAALIVETEIWPVMLTELSRMEVPAAMVNARLSQRSYPSYRAVRPLIASVLETLSAVCARDELSRARLVALGARAEHAACTGDIKLDGFVERADRDVRDLLGEFKSQRPTVVAASTHEGEEEIVLEAYSSVRRFVPDARLVLAPRHPYRCPAVLRLAADGGHAAALRSQAGPETCWDVLVVDTVGELVGFMKGAAAVFVGGSLTDVGGHNLMEPASFGVPVAAGRHLETVREQAEALEAATALTIVGDAAELARVWRRWLEQPEMARARGKRGRNVVAAGSGAVERTLQMLESRGVL